VGEKADAGCGFLITLGPKLEKLKYPFRDMELRQKGVGGGAKRPRSGGTEM